MSTRKRAAAPTDRRLVGRAFDVLVSLVNGSGHSVGVRDLATALTLPPSSVHRALTALAAEGMVARNEDGTYSLGLAFMRLACKAAARFTIRDAAQPVLVELVRACDETAMLVLYEATRHELMFASAIESSHPLRYFIAINEWMPAHSGASGTAVCAFLPEDEQEAILRMKFSSPNKASRASFVRRLDEVRRVGYAVSRGERIEGGVGVASAIFGPDGRVVGATALSIPEHRFEEEQRDRLGEQVRRAALDVTHRIGGNPPSPSVARYVPLIRTRQRPSSHR